TTRSNGSGVHPEAYPVVRRILQATKSDIHVLLGKPPCSAASTTRSNGSGVHPEAYPVVRRILQATKSDIHVLL
ncbi:hypothetical protein CTI14_70390, partial [Methylobacterium radiotolerans]